jgi:RHS repeat-associated protein
MLRPRRAHAALNSSISSALGSICSGSPRSFQMPASRSTLRRAPLDAFTDDLHTIQYTYDAISRLLEADYYPGLNVNAAPFRENAYGFDLAGNLTNLNGVSRTYNAANQLVNDGTNTLTYDANGNMTSDGANAHTWDRANRLLSMGGIEYAYNGDNNRVTQTANSIVTQYLLDMQPGLALVLGDSDGNHYIHSPRGIHAVIDGSDWTYPVQDALGSVRGYADENSAVVSNVNYSEYGLPDVAWKGWAFTGEWRDANPLQYHRARYYAPGIGVWASLDPFEGLIDRPMSLNRYGYVNGNPVNLVDLSGNCPENPGPFDFIGHECRRLAISLANRYNIPADRLLAQPYHRLLELGFWGTLHDAAIIPSISLREDPEIVIETFRQYADQILGSSGCGYEGLLTALVGAERVGGGTQAGRLGRALIPVTAIGFGIGLGVGVSLGLNTLTRGQAREDEGCDSQRFREWWSSTQSI